jgi:hypothetical protein
VRHGDLRTAHCDDVEADSDDPALKLVVYTAV